LGLYTKGRSRKYNLPNNIIRRFFKVVATLEAADSIHDLWKLTSLNFERLKGFENKYSARLTREWRLEMEIDWENEEKTKGHIFILEISKHYGD
jgi:proteic killer suppression protein